MGGDAGRGGGEVSQEEQSPVESPCPAPSAACGPVGSRAAFVAKSVVTGCQNALERCVVVRGRCPDGGGGVGGEGDCNMDMPVILVGDCCVKAIQAA